jgi:hypothetical protein
MSASIRYRIVKPEAEESLPNYGSGSAFKKSLEEAFECDLPHVFNMNYVPVLRAMSAVCGNENNGYNDMVKLILKHGAIEVWAAY